MTEPKKPRKKAPAKKKAATKKKKTTSEAAEQGESFFFKDNELSPKQILFVQYYCTNGFNATQAAIKAGYSDKCAKELGYRLLTKDHIKRYVDNYLRQIAEKNEITAERILNELAKIGFADIRGLFTSNGNLKSVSDLADNVAAAVKSVEVVTRGSKDEDGNDVPEYTHKIHLHDKKGSLELLGKHIGLYTDKVDHTSSDGSMTPVVVTQQINFDEIRKKRKKD